MSFRFLFFKKLRILIKIHIRFTVVKINNPNRPEQNRKHNQMLKNRKKRNAKDIYVTSKFCHQETAD